MSSAVSDNQNNENFEQIEQIEQKPDINNDHDTNKPNQPIESSIDQNQPIKTIDQDSNIPTVSTDNKEELITKEDLNTSNSSPLKRKETTIDSSSETPKPKKSRKLQGAGVKKPLYSRYESLYIVKAYKTISDKHPNLVLIDLFKIVALLFNEEAQRQGFKERTPDQLYQKYKRIQHGLNHGETEFLEFFKKNTYNPREWIPDFKNSESDEILKYIKFPKLDESINEIVGSSIANLKPPLPDLYDDDEFDEDTKPIIDSNPTGGATGTTEHGDAEDELLQLAGYDNENSNGNNNKSRTNSNSSHGSNNGIIKELKTKISSINQSNELLQNEIKSLKEHIISKDQEILFLKSMIKEDLSYIRHKLNEPKDGTITKE
ncbi:hypothetical protein BN7_6763 [Wickerhamomyces ciferrii]|uniref:Uncharacterized protein n=1 Tax=Wickerhamomyces ciferrii (strain ATCC 14091 / BCRC 22168 / CBS 111 / JCM 3599 / NBRC 0793 / NRRL Y-1031 F-60-10) TaxID=1206466 RepID=K0L0Q6_WICCF|nr:uncharacterized protein BN7_6763 [Wickerhamomyces ciferrii]CCH47149.1 hypothetical protein BN7_6763 [Wickerhamomyces ciferrii]